MMRSWPLFPRLFRDGWWLAAALAFATLVLLAIWAPLGWIGSMATLVTALMFRDPRRAVPVNLGLVVSPADGTVAVIDRAVSPAGLGLAGQGFTRISIRMPMLGPHGLRAPIAGRLGIAALADAGKNGVAIVLDLADGRTLGMVSTPELSPYAVVLGVSKGEGLRTGQRLGLIRFGGTVDVYLPSDLAPQVAAGQTVVAGETVIALIGQDVTARVARLD